MDRPFAVPRKGRRHPSVSLTRIGHDWLNAAINELARQRRTRSKAKSQSNGSRSSKHQQLRLERPLIIGCIHD